jgi:predicted transglutaminase-like cysteine proteinase
VDWTRVVAAGVVACLASGCATHLGSTDSLSDKAPTMSVYAIPASAYAAPAPAGFFSFCLRFAGQCENAPGAALSVSLTDDTWRALNRINRSVNDSIWPQDDIVHYGRAEYWTIPNDGYGDCDDYAVTKRKALIDAGFPASALRLAVVETPRTARHAVLTVATDKGDYVLDSLRNDIVSWNATGFVWIERQDARRPLVWGALQAGTSAPVTRVAAVGSVQDNAPAR